jgi:L-fuconate dehydratase
MFKQLFLTGAVHFCQIDPCRLGGVNECVVVMLMAKKFDVPVCPHAGGIGLGEMGQHLAAFDYIAVSGDRVNSIVEYSGHLHEHFMQPARTKHGNYTVPEVR